MTMWAAVIGSPIAHSLSPVIHRAAWEQLGIDGWEYRRAEVTEESLPPFIGQLDESFCGLSVTMPCKQAVMPLLDAIDPLASAVGAVNTVVPRQECSRDLTPMLPVLRQRSAVRARALAYPFRRVPSCSERAQLLPLPWQPWASWESRRRQWLPDVSVVPARSSPQPHASA